MADAMQLDTSKKGDMMNVMDLAVALEVAAASERRGELTHGEYSTSVSGWTT